MRTVTIGSPAATGSPTFLWNTKPTAGSIWPSTVRDRRRAACPSGRSRAASYHAPVALERTRIVSASAQRGRRDPRVAAPAARSRGGTLEPAPDWRRARARAASSDGERPASCTIRLRARSTATEVLGAAALERSISGHLQRVAGVAPSGWSIGDERRDLLAHAAPDRDHRLRERLASSRAQEGTARTSRRAPARRCPPPSSYHDRGRDERATRPSPSRRAA